MDLKLTIILLITILSTPTILQSEAAQTNYKGKTVGIVISKSCLMSTNCLNYSDIIHLDNSNPIYTGKFVEKDGDIVRKATSNQNNYKWLDFEKDFIIMVDPPLGMKTKIPLIEIIPQLDEYHLPGQMEIIEAKSAPDRTATQNIRAYAKNRYVDSSCTNAIITAKNWQVILPDTINYLRHDCDANQTQVQIVAVQLLQKTQHDITTSQKYKDEKQRAWIVANCLKSFGACPELGLTNQVIQKSTPNHFKIHLVE